MARIRRTLTVLLLSCPLVVAAGEASRASAAKPLAAPKHGSFYLALGDSLAYGITAPGVPPDSTCASADAPGYVCIVLRYLRQIDRSIQLQNFAVPEMDSCILVNGFGTDSPCKNAPPGGPVDSPLAKAVTFLVDHPGQVSPITINVGGADLVPLLPTAVTDPVGTAAKLPALYRALQVNLDTALGALRTAAGPDTEIILATQYNPLGGIPAPPLTPGLPAIARGAINSLNQVLVGAASKYDARVADVAAAFDANPQGAAVLTFVPTSLASGNPKDINIYPTPDGYQLYGLTVLKASGFQAPLRLTARISTARVRRGSVQRVTGKTTEGARVTVTYRPATGRQRHRQTLASGTGTYKLSFNVGKSVGQASERVCATDLVSVASTCVSQRFRVVP